MQLHKSNFSLAMQLVSAVTLCFAANSASAQVNVINKPFRATPATSAAQQPDLGIAPYIPQSQAQSVAPATQQPFTPYRTEQVGYWDVHLTDGTLHKALMR